MGSSGSLAAPSGVKGRALQAPDLRPPRLAVVVLREKSCGVVPFREERGEILYLVISSAVTKREHWEFPKGGVEEGEREIQTALRELREETGVTDVRILPGFREPIRYIYRRPEGLVSKQVVYFIGKVGNPKVVLRLEEAKDYRWANYDETYRLIRHANARILLERCHAFIIGKPMPSRSERRPLPPRGTASGTAAPTGPAAAQREAPPAPRQARPPQPPPHRPPLPTLAPDGPSAPTSQQADGTAPPTPEKSSKRRRRRRRRGRGDGARGAAPPEGGEGTPRQPARPNSPPSPKFPSEG